MNYLDLHHHNLNDIKVKEFIKSKIINKLKRGKVTMNEHNSNFILNFFDLPGADGVRDLRLPISPKNQTTLNHYMPQLIKELIEEGKINRDNSPDSVTFTISN
jgi:hypothetical protein